VTSSPSLWIEFGSGDLAVAGARFLRQRGMKRLNAFTPYPLLELEDALGIERPWLIPVLVLLGASLGGTLAFVVIWWTAAVNYPLNVGGRPLNSFVADIPIMFELSVLGASLTAFVLCLALSGIPRLSHPLESLPGFERTSIDRFWIGVSDTGALNDASLPDELQQIGALRVHRFTGGSGRAV
jgi:Protein of unknown function (DUF3341)